MTQKAPAPYPIGDMREWAIRLVTYLNEESIQEEVTAKPVFLTHYRAGDKAVQDGVVLFHPTIGLPIVASGGQWLTFDGTPI